MTTNIAQRYIRSRTRNTFITSRKSLNDDGHGMLYTLFAVATICIIEMPIFIMPRDAIDRSTNIVANTVHNSSGIANDATIVSGDAFVGHF